MSIAGPWGHDASVLVTPIYCPNAATFFVRFNGGPVTVGTVAWGPDVAQEAWEKFIEFYFQAQKLQPDFAWGRVPPQPIFTPWVAVCYTPLFASMPNEYWTAVERLERFVARALIEIGSSDRNLQASPCFHTTPVTLDPTYGHEPLGSDRT